MTPEEKQKINVVIAEAMGWKREKWRATNDLIDMWYNPQGQRVGSQLTFNPVDSISDAMEAMEAIFPDGYVVVIKKKNGAYTVLIDRESYLSWTYEWFQTPSAAISLALMKYLEAGASPGAGLI